MSAMEPFDPHVGTHEYEAGPKGLCWRHAPDMVRCELPEDSPFHAAPGGHTVEAVIAYEARKATRREAELLAILDGDEAA